MADKFKGSDLMRVVRGKDCEKLIEMSLQNKSKKNPFSFKDVLKELPEKEMDEMWEILSNLVLERTEALFLPNTRKSKESADNKKTCAETSHLIQAAIDLAFVVFEQSMAASVGLLRMVVFLNRSIFEIPSTMENVKNSIALLCEKMFHLKYLYQDHEMITFNTVIYLLKRSLAKKAAKKDVKRIYALRSLIPKVISMGEVDANEVWDLFKQCATSTVYLSITEGQKIISMILTTDVDRISEVHEAIKKRFLSCSLAQGSSYGKVYFDAWSQAVKSESEALKNELEIMCLQDIVLQAVNGRPKTLVAVLRKLLAQFHCQKKEIYVSKMLYTLYQPILWRYLKNPDGLIRANTAQLFLDVFPLEDPDVKVVTTDQELNEQMLMIKDLLLDDFPIVRSATIVGLCIAMSVNWELFPEDMLKTYFKTIVNDLSCDSSSSDVRCAVAKGCKVLLENPLTIPTLQVVLPKLRSLFHDVSDTVRIAFVQLLLRVKKICGIKYYDIVPPNHIMARMEEDTIIAKSLVNLIHNSYFPKTDGPEIWLARCVEMVKTDRGASRVFFQYIPNFIGLESTALFMVQAVKSIHFYVKSKVKSKKICVLSLRSNKENRNSLNGTLSDDESLEEAVGLSDPNVVSGLLDAVAIMWLASINNLEKPENKTTLKTIVARLSKYLGDLVLYYKETPVWESAYYLSSFMPSHAVPSLASLCFLRLKTMEGEALPESYLTLLECLCNHGEAPSVLLLLREWMEAGLAQITAPPAPKKRKSKANPKENPEFVPKPKLAVEMLGAMLNHRSMQKVLITRHPESLKELVSLVENFKSKVEASHEQTISQEDAAFLTTLNYELLTAAVLLHLEDHVNAVKLVEDMCLWVQEKLLKMANPDTTLSTTMSNRRSSRSAKGREAFDDLVTTICQDLCTIIIDMTMLGYMNFKTLKFIKFCIKLLNSAFGEKVLLHAAKLVHRHTSYGIYKHMKDEQVNILRVVPDCFNKIIQCLNDEAFLERIPPQDWKEIQFSLAGTILLMQQQGTFKELVSDMVLLLTKNILNSIFKDMETWEAIEKECNPFEKIPISKSGAFLLSTVCMKPKLILYFLQQLQKYIAKTGQDMQSWVACYVIVINIWEMKNLSKNINKEMRSLVSKMEVLLLEHYPLRAVERSLEKCSISLPPDTMDVATRPHDDMEDENSFKEHCQYQYQKLKDLMLQKENIT